MTTGVVHVAGIDVFVESRLRQRCAWCGAVLIELELERVQVQVVAGERPAGGPSVWPVGALVEVVEAGGVKAQSRIQASGAELPRNACGYLDPDVTR